MSRCCNTADNKLISFNAMLAALSRRPAFARTIIQFKYRKRSQTPRICDARKRDLTACLVFPCLRSRGARHDVSAGLKKGANRIESELGCKYARKNVCTNFVVIVSLHFGFARRAKYQKIIKFTSVVSMRILACSEQRLLHFRASPEKIEGISQSTKVC